MKLATMSALLQIPDAWDEAQLRDYIEQQLLSSQHEDVDVKDQGRLW